MANPTYGYTRVIKGADFASAIDKVTSALKEEGFGILTEIDVKKTLKEKLDLDFRNYKILGACNPPLAHKALEAELAIGLLLPCNVIVYERDDGEIEASFSNPRELFKIVDNPALSDVVGEVDARLQRAADACSQ